MSDERAATEFLADTAKRMIQFGVESRPGNLIIAGVLSSVLDSLVSVDEDDPASDFAEEMVLSIVDLLTYAHVVDEEAEVAKLAEQFDLLEHIRKNNHEEEPNNGNGND